MAMKMATGKTVRPAATKGTHSKKGAATKPAATSESPAKIVVRKSAAPASSPAKRFDAALDRVKRRNKDLSADLDALLAVLK